MQPSRVQPVFGEFATGDLACQEHTGWWYQFLADGQCSPLAPCDGKTSRGA